MKELNEGWLASYQIPPLASDIAGAASVLYHLPATVLLLSPGCCHQVIQEVDEYRSLKEGRLYTTRFEDLDMIEGLEVFMDSLGKKILDLPGEQSETRGGCANPLILLGTFVTDMTGVRLARAAKKLESILGRKVLFLNTNGMEDYKRGVERVYDKLAEHFLLELPQDVGQGKKIVNILGYNPLSLGKDEAMTVLLNKLYHPQIQYSFWGLPESSGGAAYLYRNADFNLVISEEAEILAKRLQEEKGTPYYAGIPIGKGGTTEVYKILEKTLNLSPFCDTEKGCQLTEKFLGISWNELSNKIIHGGKILVLRKSIAAGTLARTLCEEFSINLEDILPFVENEDYRAYYSDIMSNKLHKKTDIIIGDDLLRGYYPGVKQENWISWPYMALSGRW